MFRFPTFIEEPSETPAAAVRKGVTESRAKIERDPMTRRETLELVRAYYRIEDPEVREHLQKLIRAAASAVR